jgi:hypothetical protein
MHIGSASWKSHGSLTLVYIRLHHFLHYGVSNEPRSVVLEGIQMDKANQSRKGPTWFSFAVDDC